MNTEIDDTKFEEIVKDLPSRNFCPAPFIHGYINANNRSFKLCGMSHIVARWDNSKNLKEQHADFWSSDLMQKIRKSFIDGKFPEPCNWWCGKLEQEKKYFKSDRLDFIKLYSEELGNKIFKLSWSLKHGTEEYKAPIDIDIRSGKLCNLKCRSCNSIWSSEIEKEVLSHPEIQGWTHWDMITQSKSSLNRAKQIDWSDPKFDIISDFNFDDAIRISISGGESLIDPRVFIILQKLVILNKAKTIKLHIITNATSLPKRMIDVISQFKSVSFNVSIDGIEKTEEFLRHGTIWNKKIKVFEKLFEFRNLNWVGILHTVQPINALQIKKNIKWFLEQIRRFDKLSSIMFNPVIDPWYLNISWLDDDHKDFIKNQIHECYTEFNMTDIEKKWVSMVLRDLEYDHGDRRERYMNDFVRAELALNKIRGTNTLDIEPMLERYFKRYNPQNVTNTIVNGRPGTYFDDKPKPYAK